MSEPTIFDNIKYFIQLLYFRITVRWNNFINKPLTIKQFSSYVIIFLLGVWIGNMSVKTSRFQEGRVAGFFESKEFIMGVLKHEERKN